MEQAAGGARLAQQALLAVLDLLRPPGQTDRLDGEPARASEG